MKKRLVFLLGAGATLDWHNAPTTNAITENLLERGFKNKKGNTVTSVIYEWLCNKTENKNDINFETIINVIEDFIQYWSLDDSTQIHGLTYFIERSCEKWEDFMYFDTVSATQIKITSEDEAINSKGYFNVGSSPEAKYFELLLMEILDAISSYISEYSYCTKDYQLVIESKENKEINKLAISYFNKIKNHHLRVYSLNYDLIVQYLFTKTDIQAFQGFSTMKLFPELGERYNLDSLKILTERDTNCIYHLHGNVNWEMNSINENQFPSYSFTLSDGPNLIFNNDFPEISLEKGKKMLVSSIITGFQKAQRTSLAPFRQMASSFDLDCHTGDELIIIGYSFGDEHINDIIRNARKYNMNIKITIIDPAFDDNDFLIEFLSHWGNLKFGLFDNKGNDRIIIKDFNVVIYKITLKEYLKHEFNLSS